MNRNRVVRIVRDLSSASVQELFTAMEVLIAEVPQMQRTLGWILSETEPSTMANNAMDILHRNSDICIKSYPREKKIPIIKVIREHTRCGLKEAKEASESGARRLLQQNNLRCDNVINFCQDLKRAGADAVLV